MSGFHESIKSLLSDIEKFLIETLKNEKLGKSAKSYKQEIIDKICKLKEEWPQLGSVHTAEQVKPAKDVPKDDESTRTGGSSNTDETEDPYADSSADIPNVPAMDLTNFTKAGFLEKKRPTGLKTMQKRWCVIKGNIFFYFDGKTSKKMSGLIYQIIVLKKHQRCLWSSKSEVEEWKTAVKQASVVVPSKITDVDNEDDGDIYEPVGEEAQETQELYDDGTEGDIYEAEPSLIHQNLYKMIFMMKEHLYQYKRRSTTVTRLTLQASIEAGITPADSYVNEGLTETQLLEHQIAVATQELQNMTSDQQPLPPSSMSLSSLENTTLPSTDHMQHNTTESLQQNAVLASTEPLPTELTSEAEQQPQTNATDEPLATEVTEQTSEKEKEIEEKELDYSYEIKIFKDDGYVDNIDISDEDKCNWMMFVRPARNTAEQNVVVYQQDEHIFFVSIKPIPSNTEIKVWYSAEYAEMMDKPLLPDPEPIITETPDQEATGVAAKWVCSVCYDGFSAFADLEAHLCPGLPPDSRRLRGRPRKGRPRKYIKPSKTWRARLEKSRMLKAKVVDPSQSQPLPPRRRGRPPKNKRPALDIPPPLQVEETPDDQVLDGEPEDKAYMEQVMDDDEDEEKTTTEMLDEILGADEDYPEPMPRRRGRKKGRIPRGPRASRREPMQCPHCTETFTKEALFVIHVSDHTEVKPFICEVAECSKGFMSKFKLERHRLIHTCPRHHKCPYCDKSFNRKDHLKNHMITHDPNKKRWVCEECGKEYSYNFSYRTHKAFHDADAGRSTEWNLSQAARD
ncbi:unnamed protein product [Mytilus edulis]|uniref:Uncharacterized protein n=1 Tax=Mytilus edulis TaxID=6550 RepID=A0A8S3UL10_MYTED|nr:unnamed protein product [Mytilus edulis]